MLTPHLFKYRKFNFPVGEKHVQISECDCDQVSITLDFEHNEDIIELLLLADALKRMGKVIDKLIIPYTPFGRQDRVANEGEPLSLAVFATLINSVGAKRVITYDPHSDVTAALINNVEIVPQTTIFAPILENIGRFYLVSPDAGAEKKIFKLAASVKPIDVLQCSKIRNPQNGQILDTYVPAPETIEANAKYVIVDDICDGGQTFIKLGEKLKAYGASEVILCVTHGFFTKGLGVFKGKIDRIFTRKGEVKL